MKNSLKDIQPLSQLQFFHFPKLEYLDIRQNYRFEGAFSFELFLELMRQLPVKIKSLWTNIPADSNFVLGFVNFTDLTELGIRSYGSYPLRILNNTFEMVSHLPIRNLTISAGRLTDVEPLAFSWFNQLEYLDMSNCTGRLSIADLYPAWYGLQFTQLKWLILSSFSQDGK